MFVYLLSYDVQHEDSQVVGVFTTMAKAKTAAQEVASPHDFPDKPKWVGDRKFASWWSSRTRVWYAVTKIRVDEIVNPM